MEIQKNSSKNDGWVTVSSVPSSAIQKSRSDPWYTHEYKFTDSDVNAVRIVLRFDTKTFCNLYQIVGLNDMGFSIQTFCEQDFCSPAEKQPTLTPTSIASTPPTAITSKTPSSPSRVPSSVPNRIPSQVPSQVPSRAPSRTPTEAPIARSFILNVQQNIMGVSYQDYLRGTETAKRVIMETILEGLPSQFSFENFVDFIVSEKNSALLLRKQRFLQNLDGVEVKYELSSPPDINSDVDIVRLNLENYIESEHFVADIKKMAQKYSANGFQNVASSDATIEAFVLTEEPTASPSTSSGLLDSLVVIVPLFVIALVIFFAVYSRCHRSRQSHEATYIEEIEPVPTVAVPVTDIPIAYNIDEKVSRPSAPVAILQT